MVVGMELSDSHEWASDWVDRQVGVGLVNLICGLVETKINGWVIRRMSGGVDRWMDA